jgi:hypothetical protein
MLIQIVVAVLVVVGGDDEVEVEENNVLSLW